METRENLSFLLNGLTLKEAIGLLKELALKHGDAATIDSEDVSFMLSPEPEFYLFVNPKNDSAPSER